MLKLLTTAYLALFLVFSPVQANSTEDTLVQGLSTTQMARDAVVKVVSQDETVGNSCSAVIVAPNRALTAAHCVDIPAMALLMHNGDVLPVISFEVDQQGRDLATLHVVNLRGAYAFTTDIPVQTDEMVFAVGYPYGVGPVLTVGTFQFRITNPMVGQTFLLSTVQVAPGNSGGALYVVRDGAPYLVGIVVAYLGTNHLAISVELP